jgi:undecaprenyl-diphosphatase
MCRRLRDVVAHARDPRNVGWVVSAAGDTQAFALPGALRRPAVLVMLLAGLLFAVLAAHYRGEDEPGRLDVRAEHIVDAFPATTDPLLRGVVRLGDPMPVVVLAAALAAVAVLLGRRRLALLAIVGPGLTGVATTLVKPAVGRVLKGDFAYPSGHAGAATALGIVAALLLVSVVPMGRLWQLLVIGIGALATGGLMSVGLTLRDWHYPTDTVGGCCLAIVIVLGLALLLDHFADRSLAPRVGVRQE